MSGDGADYLRSLGYRWNGRGWVLENPDAKPSWRPKLCNACQKFDAHPEWGYCNACMYFGLGDPHNLGRQRLRERLRERAREVDA